MRPRILSGGIDGIDARWVKHPSGSTSLRRPTRGSSPSASVVELTPGGHVTPLAQDTLRARRVTVVPAGSSDPFLPPDLAPVADVRRIAIGSDHTGLALKRALVQHLRQKGLAVDDRGTDSQEPVDYPDVAAAVGIAVARGEADAGIVIDGAGLARRSRRTRSAACARRCART